MSRTIVTVRRLDPSGEYTDVHLDGATNVRQLQEAVGGHIEHLGISEELGAFVCDTARLDRMALNVPLSMVCRRAVYGPAVLIDEREEETLPPPDECEALKVLDAIAALWSFVALSCVVVGDDPYAYADPENIPSPLVLFGHELATFLGERGIGVTFAEGWDEEREHGDESTPLAPPDPLTRVDDDERDEDGGFDYPEGGCLS